MATICTISFSHSSDDVQSTRKLPSVNEVVGKGCVNEIDFKQGWFQTTQEQRKTSLINDSALF